MFDEIRFNTIDEIKDKIDLERSCIIFIDCYDVHFIFPAFRLAKEQISNCRNPEIRAAFEEILNWFENEAKKIFDELENKSWYAKVEKEILKNIGEKEVTIDLISSNLGTTPRTLQNYLKAENKTFRDALNKIRQKLAQHYRENTKMDLGTISILLGYSEASSFFRAYKKWNKKTPKQAK